MCKGACGRERGREGGIFACVQGCMWEGEDVRGCTGEGGDCMCVGARERSVVCVCTRKKRAEIKFVNVNASMLQRMLCTGHQ